MGWEDGAKRDGVLLAGLMTAAAALSAAAEDDSWEQLSAAMLLFMAG